MISVVITAITALLVVDSKDLTFCNGADWNMTKRNELLHIG